MAEIYGRPESEKEILRLCTPDVSRLEDIDTFYHNLQRVLNQEKKDFFDKLPEVLDEERRKLNEMKKQRERKILEYENKINEIEESIEKNKNDKKYFSVISNYIQIFFQKYISKPWNVRKINKFELKQERILSQWEEHPHEIFSQQQQDLINQKTHLKSIKDNPFYSGAYGELKVLKELLKLNDKYAVLCGVNLELDDWVRYNNKHNLKSA